MEVWEMGMIIAPLSGFGWNLKSAIVWHSRRNAGWDKIRKRSGRREGNVLKRNTQRSAAKTVLDLWDNF